jgi:hypothetical protein
MDNKNQTPVQKEYSVWVAVNGKSLSLLWDGKDYMPYNIALEKVTNYMESLEDLKDWKEVSPIGVETIRWENGKDDRIFISEKVELKPKAT